ncbi:hypothetical protein J6TS7_61750 [Paenibacillus dendritiformis]|nr:hypothetical protein J6TS7_61750 [Paenibacillus dendritiformis]
MFRLYEFMKGEKKQYMALGHHNLGREVSVRSLEWDMEGG